jgi:hypothetical protein
MLPFGGAIRIIAVLASAIATYTLATRGLLSEPWQAALVCSILTHVIQLAVVRNYSSQAFGKNWIMAIALQAVLFAAVLWVLFESVDPLRAPTLLRAAGTAVTVVIMLALSERLVRRVAVSGNQTS